MPGVSGCRISTRDSMLRAAALRGWQNRNHRRRRIDPPVDLLLLATAPGERVMHPDYGCNLHRLVFAPNDESTAGLAMHYVRQSIERFEPRVEILALDAMRSPDRPELLDISLAYQVRATQQTGQITFSMNLMEGEV